MKRIKGSLYLNSIIFILVFLGTTFMITGFHFMSDEVILESTKLNAFKFFTVDSNILMGLIALLFVYFEYQIIKKRKKTIPQELYVMKLMFTVGVMVTFLVTTLYLAPFSPNGYFSMFQNSNLFFHLIVPILSLISFIFFEKTDKIKFKHTFLGMVPTLTYAIFYVANILVHLENGKVSYTYDWYGFAQGGLVSTLFVFIFMHLATYIVSLSLWFLNRKKVGK